MKYKAGTYKIKPEPYPDTHRYHGENSCKQWPKTKSQYDVKKIDYYHAANCKNCMPIMNAEGNATSHGFKAFPRIKQHDTYHNEKETISPGKIAQ